MERPGVGGGEGEISSNEGGLGSREQNDIPQPAACRITDKNT